MDLVGTLRRSWWRHAHRKFYRTEVGRSDPYALNAGSAQAFDSLIAGLHAMVQPAPADVVLDLGGGNGRVSGMLFKTCRRLVVVDLCRPEGALQSAFVVADMCAPPFRAGAFTKLFSYSTFPHLGSTTAALNMLQAWDTLLAPGGLLFIGDIPDRSKRGTMLMRGISRLPSPNGVKYYAAVSLISVFSRTKLKSYLESIGYEVTVLDQPTTRRFHRERFDLLARKVAR